VKRLELLCLGPPVVRVDGQDPSPEILWKKNVALLAYLACSPGRSRTRAHLLGLLWPEKDERHARHSLNEALRRLRQGLGEGRLGTRGDQVELSDENLELDLRRFAELAERAPHEALALLRGEFLEGFAVDDAPAFEDWAAAERVRCRDRAADLLVSAGERALAESQYGEARALARRALALHAFAERGLRLAMRAAALGGDPASALETFREFERRLATELNEKPSRELDGLAQRIRAQRWRRRSLAYADLEPPLVGREAQRARAFRLVGGLATGARILVVCGESGCGRTRLLSECTSRLALDGALVVSATPLEADRSTEWSALRQLMRGGLAGAPGLLGAEPEALSVLAGVVPELAARVASRGALDTSHVAHALLAALGAVAEETPVALVLDDAHHADRSTLAALSRAMRTLRDQPLALLLAAPDEAAETPTALTQLMAEIGRSISGEVLRLGPLAAPAVHELVGAMAPWCDEVQRDRLARRLAFDTGGNPLLLVTLLRGLAEVATLREDATTWPPPRVTMEAPVPITLPHLVRMVTLARTRQLDHTTRQVLVAACVCQRDMTRERLGALTQVDDRSLTTALAELERRRFLLLDGDYYAVAAPVIARAVADELLTEGERRRLRDRWEAIRGAGSG
jgi:DNA-binding SARP family transcriptional activator